MYVQFPFHTTSEHCCFTSLLWDGILASCANDGFNHILFTAKLEKIYIIDIVLAWRGTNTEIERDGERRVSGRRGSERKGERKTLFEIFVCAYECAMLNRGDFSNWSHSTIWTALAALTHIYMRVGCIFELWSVRSYSFTIDIIVFYFIPLTLIVIRISWHLDIFHFFFCC